MMLFMKEKLDEIKVEWNNRNKLGDCNQLADKITFF